VLTSAAILDDVVGLVMVKVISDLGGEGTTLKAGTIVRPVMVSIGFVIVVPLVCVGVARPMMRCLNGDQQCTSGAWMRRMRESERTAVILHVVVLVGFVAAASYAGTSVLLAAYLAGATVTWWDIEVTRKHEVSVHHAQAQAQAQIHQESARSAAESSSPPLTHRMVSKNQQSNAHQQTEASKARSGYCGTATYEVYFRQPVERILKPFFFASIGFSIPIASMFDGAVVWRGIVYTILMMFGKLLCGLWLVRARIPTPRFEKMRPPGRSQTLSKFSSKLRAYLWSQSQKTKADTSNGIERKSTAMKGKNKAEPTSLKQQSQSTSPLPKLSPIAPQSATTLPPKPHSLYPSTILSFAMVARGEIGFLISSLAQSRGIFSRNSAPSAHGAESGEEIFLVVTWAIMLCTIIGPVCVGLLVRRVKRLDSNGTRRENVLGAWGID
jgi:Kef-type K+ transport system membrane component KefB